MMVKEEPVVSRESRAWWSGFCGTATPVDRANTRRLNRAALVWTVVTLASLVAKERYDDQLAIAVGALVLTAVAWIPVVRAYLRFLRGTDELTRLIQTQAMAVGFATGIVMTVMREFVDSVAGLASAAWDVPLKLLHPNLGMVVAFMVTTLVLHRRYSR
jgi:branched-subunit amino acid ABC-type transport system permease component